MTRSLFGSNPIMQIHRLESADTMLIDSSTNNPEERETILIVDDEPFNQIALETLINAFFSFNIEKASGGL